PEPIQIVLPEAELLLEEYDWREKAVEIRQRDVEALAQKERERGVDLACPPLMRVVMVRISDDKTELIWTGHQILMYGWSSGQLIGELLSVYQSLSSGEEPKYVNRPPYKDYLGWLKNQDSGKAERYWKIRLGGFASPTPLPMRSVNRRPRVFTCRQYDL